MKHYKTNTISDRELYEKLDYFDYSEFDDDYYFDLVEDREKGDSKHKRPPRKSSRYRKAYQDYVRGF